MTISLGLSLLICNIGMIIIISASNSCCKGYITSDHVREVVTVLITPPRALEAPGGSMEVIWCFRCKFGARSWGQALVLAFISWLFTSKQLFQCLPLAIPLTTYANTVLNCFGSFLCRIPILCFICICLF